jgi:hypothetical protein
LVFSDLFNHSASMNRYMWSFSTIAQVWTDDTCGVWCCSILEKSIGVGLVLGIFAFSCTTGEEAIYLLRQYFATLFDRVDYQVICRTPDLGESLQNWFWRTRRRRWTKSSGILMVTLSCVGTQLRSYRACSHRLQRVHHSDSSPTLRKLKTLVPSLARSTQNKQTRIRIGVAFTRGCGMLCFCFFCNNILWETKQKRKYSRIVFLLCGWGQSTQVI